MSIVSFRYHSTTTQGKLDIIRRQKSVVSYAYNGMKMEGKGISLPGNYTQLKRHINELSAYGISEQNQIMVDWDYGICFDLEREAKKLDFKGKVVHADLSSVVRDLWKKGEQVDIIDFDDVGYLDQYHLDLLDEACKNDVKVFIGVFATRGNRGGLNDFQDRMRRKLNVNGYYHRRGNYTYSLKEIQGEAVRSIAKQNGYRCDYAGYQGLSTMVSCMVTK